MSNGIGKEKIVDSLPKLNRNQLKYVLIAAMLIDHLAWSFVPTLSVLGQIMHIIGRLTGPSMAVLLAEGYQYTRNKKKYALRLFIFALISVVPYSLYETGKIVTIEQSVIVTLFMAFMIIWMWDCAKIPKAAKVTIVVFACLLSMICDWAISAILWALFAYIYRDDEKRKWRSFLIIAFIKCTLSMVMSIGADGGAMRQFFQVGVILVPIVMIFFYDGSKGSKAPIHKWFFYVFYPAHLLILYFVKLWVFSL